MFAAKQAQKPQTWGWDMPSVLLFMEQNTLLPVCWQLVVPPLRTWLFAEFKRNTSLSKMFTLVFWHPQAGVVFSRLKGCPLYIRILRWRAHDGTMYRPIVKHLRALRTENPTLQLTPLPSPQSGPQDLKPSTSQCLKEGRQVGCLHLLFIIISNNRFLICVPVSGLYILCNIWERPTLEW